MSDDVALAINRINPPELNTPPGFTQVVDVRCGRIIFIAGQTALNRNGELVGKDDFAAQVTQVFRNVDVALKSVGCTAANLLKLTVYVRDMDNLALYREARNRFFATTTPPAAPAVTLVEVSRLYGSDFMIEIEAVAAA
jgi:enamine deaminase RidA (YjgF/YER057c/UK114 family)